MSRSSFPPTLSLSCTLHSLGSGHWHLCLWKRREVLKKEGLLAQRFFRSLLDQAYHLVLNAPVARK